MAILPAAISAMPAVTHDVRLIVGYGSAQARCQRKRNRKAIGHAYHYIANEVRTLKMLLLMCQYLFLKRQM